MRVMFWSAVYWPHMGGVQELANKLLPALTARGHQFVVVAEQDPPDLPAEDKHNGIPIYRFPFAKGLRNIDQLAEIRKQVLRLKRDFAPNLSHTAALGTTDFYYRITADTQRTPLLVALYGEWPHRYDRLLSTTFSSADWIVCDSIGTLEYARRLAPSAGGISSVIHNAVEVPQLAPSPLSFDAPRLLYLGRLSKEKGVDLALEAFASVSKHHPCARFVIAGDGPERNTLEQQTIRLGLAETVRFEGWVEPEEVPALLNTAVMLLLPSRAESFPLAGLEASLMERPVVATRVGGLPELVVHGETGRLVDKENPPALAEAISYLLEHPEDAMRMGKAARNRTLESFSFDRLVDAYDNLYRLIVQDWRGRCATTGKTS